MCVCVRACVRACVCVFFDNVRTIGGVELPRIRSRPVQCCAIRNPDYFNMLLMSLCVQDPVVHRTI